MPNSAEHKEKAEQFLDCLHSRQLPPEWSAVVTFYAALHLIERLSACENLHNAKHHDRLSWLSKHKTQRVIHADFLALYDASLVGRYGTCGQFKRAYPGDTVKRQLIGKCLAAVIRHVENHFAAGDKSAD